MNIDSYKSHVHHGLRKLEQLVTNINDIIEHRVEKNLKVVSRTLLVDLPENQSFTVEEFVKMQESHIMSESELLQGKNLEIEHAVEDLVKIIAAYQFDSHVERVSDDEISKLKKHYNHFMYQALLHCAKNLFMSFFPHRMRDSACSLCFWDRFLVIGRRILVPCISSTLGD